MCSEAFTEQGPRVRIWQYNLLPNAPNRIMSQQMTINRPTTICTHIWTDGSASPSSGVSRMPSKFHILLIQRLQCRAADCISIQLLPKTINTPSVCTCNLGAINRVWILRTFTRNKLKTSRQKCSQHSPQAAFGESSTCEPQNAGSCCNCK